MFKITDTVEMGHSPLTGGSIEISIELDGIPPKKKIKEILEAIDCLDHCLVSDNAAFIEFSERSFLLDKSVSLFEDVHTILYHLLKEDYLCTVQLGKESYTNRLKRSSELLSYNHKGQ